MTDHLSDYALALPGAWPDEPWEGDAVAKVGPEGDGKIAESYARVVGKLPTKHRPEGWDT